MTKKRTPPQLLVERAALGELPEDVAAAYDVTPEDLASAVQDLRSSDRDILKTYPADEMVAAIQARANTNTRTPRQAGTWSSSMWSSSRRVGTLAIAALAMLASVVLLLPEPQPQATFDDTQDTVRLKGLDPKLSIWRKTSQGEPEQLRTKHTVRPGDVLQLKYRAAGHPHGLIASIDGHGAVTLHFPETERASTSLEQGGDIALPYGYDLDDAPRFERFFLVTSATPIDIPKTLAKIRALATTPSPESSPVPWSPQVRVDDVLLYKEVAP